MSFTRNQAYEALASLNPAPVFLEAYHAQDLPENLDIYFGPPEEFFIASNTQAPYTHGKLIPILDDGNFGVVTFLNPDNSSLIQIDVEAPNEQRAAFQNWQQYLADLMLRIADSVDSDDRIRSIANLVGFAYTKELFEFFDRAQKLSNDKWLAARQVFLSSIV